MLPALTTHLKAISASLWVLLQTTLAPQLPSLWWAAPPDKLFHLTPLVITSGRPRPCHGSLSSCFSKQRRCVFHTSRCTLTVKSATVWPPPHRGCDGPGPGVTLTPFFWVLFSQLWRGDACHRPPPRWPRKIWWLIWGSDVANAVHNQKFNTRGHHKCALSNIKIVWTHFKMHIITVEGNYRCSSFRW